MCKNHADGFDNDYMFDVFEVKIPITINKMHKFLENLEECSLYIKF